MAEAMRKRGIIVNFFGLDLQETVRIIYEKLRLDSGL